MNPPAKTVRSEQHGASFRLTPDVARQLHARLPAVAQNVVDAIVSEVPTYADPFRSGMGATIERAVRVALDGFLELAADPKATASAVTGRPGQRRAVVGAARALGQGEARAGRSIDALTSAYGVGTRVAWRDLGAGAISAGVSADDVAQLAELLFGYINELSVESITGHAEELASAGRVRERRLERLAQKLLEGAGGDELAAAARVAEWEPSRYLIAVLVPGADADRFGSRLPSQALAPGEDPADLPAGRAVLLVPADSVRDRLSLIAALGAGAGAGVVGPLRPWISVRESYLRALRTERLLSIPDAGAVDADAHLLEIVLAADADALGELRRRVLAPLEAVNPAAREKLTATLRSWLLHHGRREDIAAELVVHPQTVRYRVGQLRDLFGEALTDPRSVLELTVVLAAPEIRE